MKILIFDFEVDIHNKGHPFDARNKAVVLGLKWLDDRPQQVWFDDVVNIQGIIDEADMLVGFNAKFDLHWLRREGFSFEGKMIWDCQLGEFILNNQKTPYPSLNDALAKYGYPLKIDVIKQEYWDKGITTSDIPRPILSKYLDGDLIGTENVFKEQYKQFKIDPRYPLFRLQCQDLLVLEEMEYNGILYDVQASEEKAKQIKEELDAINKELSKYIVGIPFNFNSGDHLSCLLYGGSIVVDDRIPIGVYKTGTKIGQTRYKIIEKKFELPRLIEPLKGTELKKEGYWKTDEKTLRSLKLNKDTRRLVDLLLKYSELEKLCSTYLLGFPKKIVEMNWTDNVIHGNLNQCVVVTGRLSSTNPNLQNADPITKTFMVSRYV